MSPSAKWLLLDLLMAVVVMIIALIVSVLAILAELHLPRFVYWISTFIT